MRFHICKHPEPIPGFGLVLGQVYRGKDSRHRAWASYSLIRVILAPVDNEFLAIGQHDFA